MVAPLSCAWRHKLAFGFARGTNVNLPIICECARSDICVGVQTLHSYVPCYSSVGTSFFSAITDYLDKAPKQVKIGQNRPKDARTGQKGQAGQNRIHYQNTRIQYTLSTNFPKEVL